VSAAKSFCPARHGRVVTTTSEPSQTQQVRQRSRGNIPVDKRPVAYLMAQPMTPSRCLYQGSRQALPAAQVTPFKREQPELRKIALVRFGQIVLAVDELWLSSEL